AGAGRELTHCLSPRVYQQTLLQDGLYDLLENEKLVDCKLKIKDKEFPCHRLVLCACSSYFRAIFLSDLDESKKKEIVLEDVEPGVMGLILKYLYTSQINVTEQNVQDIFAVANMYQIPSIFTVCVSFLQKRLSLSNCLAIFRLGLMLDCPRLAVSARNYACERFQLISRDEEFFQLLPSELAAILANDNLNVESEEVVFDSLMTWVSRDLENREKELPSLIDLVRLRLVTDDYLKEKVEAHTLISSNAEIKQKLQMVWDARAGKMPEVQKSKKEGADGEDEEKGEEEELLPAILNDSLRFGMFCRDLILMINDSGTVAYDPTGNDCFLASLSTQIPKNHVSLVTKEQQVFVAGGLFFDEQSEDNQMCSYFLQVQFCISFHYDPMTADWLGMPPKGRKQVCIRLLYIFRCPLHVFVTHSDVCRKCLKKMCAYNAKRFEWKELAPMKTCRSLFGATVHNDKIYVAAGVTDDGLTDSLEVYDIATNKWSDLQPFPQERSSLNLVSLAGTLFGISGFAMMPLEDSDEMVPKEMNDIWRFNEADQQWNGVLREIKYVSGATVLGVRLNTLRLPKM
uniref:Kelch-like family member 40b n=1 Tax=Neogobius melanostomus TaxID=47308 RepID=A0A8C6SSG7_9GOBI